MGRQIKRVPLAFAWPKEKIWKGYLNPYYVHSKECEFCKGSGYSQYAKHFQDLWYGNAPFKPEDNGSTPLTPDHPKVWAFAKRNSDSAPEFYGRSESDIRREAVRLCTLFNSEWKHHLNDDDIKILIEKGDLKDLTHTWTQKKGWQPKEPAYIPTAREVNDWSIGGMGVDAYHMIEAKCKKKKLPYMCASCKGYGSVWDSKANEIKADKWEREEPPEGEGYQLWETVSEGAPITPVFATPEELADWLITPGNCWELDKGTTKAQWIKFINGPGWAPSMMASPKTGLVSGVVGVVENNA